jgi:uncharacterized protein
MIILIHTSKTMRPRVEDNQINLAPPLLITHAAILASYLKTLSHNELKKAMSISDKLADKTKELISSWTDDPKHQRSAIDSFIGDIYSGLQVQNWTQSDREYANEHLRILSGLYGILRPLDGIFPYRLEMGYSFANNAYKNLYNFWGDSIVKTLPKNDIIIDLAAVEYSKTVTKYIEPSLVIAPRFLTINPESGEPTFVVVHAKIARGAFASWMIRNKINELEQLQEFNEIGYHFDEKLSTTQIPVFICKKFEGIGLSIRLS